MASDVLQWIGVGVAGAAGLAMAIVVLCGAAWILVATVHDLKGGR